MEVFMHALYIRVSFFGRKFVFFLLKDDYFLSLSLSLSQIFCSHFLYIHGRLCAHQNGFNTLNTLAGICFSIFVVFVCLTMLPKHWSRVWCWLGCSWKVKVQGECNYLIWETGNEANGKEWLRGDEHALLLDVCVLLKFSLHLHLLTTIQRNLRTNAPMIVFPPFFVFFPLSHRCFLILHQTELMEHSTVRPKM